MKFHFLTCSTLRPRIMFTMAVMCIHSFIICIEYEVQHKNVTLKWRLLNGKPAICLLFNS